MPVISALFHLVAAVVVVTEFLLLRRLHPSYADAVRLRAAGSSVPDVPDPAALAGLEGLTANVHYRWDATRGALYFRRRWGVLPGERGLPVGAVRFRAGGSPAVTWHPGLLSLAPLILLACVGASAWFVLVEGELGGLAIVPGALVFFAPVAVILGWNARGVLERVVLPELAEVIRDRMGESDPRR